MTERYQFNKPETDGLMQELFNTEERLQSREYKTAAALDRLEPLSEEQMHLILHAFFADEDASLSEIISMVAEVLLAGPELAHDYPEAEELEEKIAEVKRVFAPFISSPQAAN